ncbi:hypothetical protein ACX1C1_03445 [Paenibacillus sp. strain BS8-2]
MDLSLPHNEHLTLWSYAHIRIIRLAKQSLLPGAQSVGISFPTSGFFCVSSGGARMLLNNRIFSPARMSIYHVPPLSRMELSAGGDGLDYYILHYKRR